MNAQRGKSTVTIIVSILVLVVLTAIAIPAWRNHQTGGRIADAPPVLPLAAERVPSAYDRPVHRHRHRRPRRRRHLDGFWFSGLLPVTASSATTRHHVRPPILSRVQRVGFEPTTSGLEDRHSAELSYRCRGHWSLVIGHSQGFSIGSLPRVTSDREPVTFKCGLPDSNQDERCFKPSLYRLS